MGGKKVREPGTRRPSPPPFRLRPLTLGDAPALARLCADPAVSRMTGRMPHPYRIEDAEAYLAALLGVAAPERVFGVEALFENGATLAGATGWSPIQHQGSVELGYWLGRPFWGRGLMTDACTAALRRAFADRSLLHVTAATFEDNRSSARVLEKLGFQRTSAGQRRALGRGGGDHPAHLWALSRKQWERGHEISG